MEQHLKGYLSTWVVIVIALTGAGGCAKNTQAARAPEPLVVQVAAVEQRGVPIYSEWIGTLDGYVNADIKAQVTGYLQKQDYTEGSFVQKGQLLFEIDPRPFQAVADQTRGQLSQANGQLSQAKAQLAQVLMSRAWEKQLTTGQPERPWPWADFTPVAKLSFPNQKQSVLALSDAAGESLAFGPTLVAASAKPGRPGVTVFAAHRDTHFAFLGKLRAGDNVKVETAEGPLTYRIIGAEVVRDAGRRAGFARDGSARGRPEGAEDHSGVRVEGSAVVGR